MKLLLLTLLLIIHSIRIYGQQISFDHFLEQLNGIEDDGNFQNALEFLGSHEKCFQDQWFALSKEQIYLNEKLKKFEENLSVFQEGHRKGFFYFLHPAIPRFKPYLDFPGFEDLVEADQKLHRLALERSSTLCQVDLPPNYTDHSYPLFIIFHGGNSNFQRLRKHWNEASLNKDFIKVYLQSYRHFDSESFTWRSGDPRSDREIKSILKDIQLMYQVDTSNIVVAGMSAGSNYAIGMALRGVIPVSGILAFCPGLPKEMRSDKDFQSFHTDIKAYLLGGEHDYYLEHQEKLTEIFDQIGLEYLYVIEEGMSHQYPEDEEKYISEGLQFIMTK